MDFHNVTCDEVAIQACVSYVNCTGSAYVPGWTDKCCQPEEVKHWRLMLLSVTGGGRLEFLRNKLSICRFCWSFGVSLQYSDSINICISLLLPRANQKKIWSRVCLFDQQSSNCHDFTLVLM